MTVGEYKLVVLRDDGEWKFVGLVRVGDVMRLLMETERVDRAPIIDCEEHDDDGFNTGDSDSDVPQS